LGRELGKDELEGFESFFYGACDTPANNEYFEILSWCTSSNIEIEGKEYEVGPGTLVIFPAGVPHRNWNGSSGPTLHLAFNTPMPDPNVPFATSVKP
jgi:uncharacterized cupin superfamily protein